MCTYEDGYQQLEDVGQMEEELSSIGTNYDE